jgi:hypothetical protein
LCLLIRRAMPVPVSARSKTLVWFYSPAEIVGSNPTGAWMSVCCECCVLLGKGLCDGLITRPEKSYRLWCVVVCDHESSTMRRLCPTGGCFATVYKKKRTAIKQFVVIIKTHHFCQLRPNFIHHSVVKVNSICTGNYWGSSV